MRRGLAMLSTSGAADRFALLRSFIGPAESEVLYAGELGETRRETRGGALQHLAQLYRECAGSELRRMRYVDIATYLADGLMPKVDVATMAHGLEARAPLLDQEVVRFSLTLPDEFLIDQHGGKRILRSVISRYLPAELFQRPKQGFTVPLERWFATGLRAVISSLPASERLMATGFFRPRGIATLINEHLIGHRDHSQRLFALMVFDEWLKGT
jgi:asparagine synthase (glutamine-hydrolysing)